MPSPSVGARVEVPFAGRRVVGVALGPGAPPPKGRLADVVDVIDETPLASPTLVELALWMADYYLAPVGECLRLLLPPQGIRSSRAVVRLSGTLTDATDPVLRLLRDGPLPVSTLAHRLGGDPSGALVRLRRAGLVALEQDLGTSGFRTYRVVQLTGSGGAGSGKAQQEVVRRLQAAGGRVPLAELVRDRPSLRSAVTALERAGGVRLDEERSTRAPATMEGEAAPRPTPTAGQLDVLGSIVEALDARRFATFLLHGVTGSGKTEVYFLAIEQALRADLGALILVPEIALTPFLVRAAAARFGESVAVLHSDLSRGERHDQWWRIREGAARVVVGARSAVFAPIAPLGLIVVDEEHEGSYKQDEAPRYHARDVAVMRGKIEGAVVVLGSATPSVESYHNARQGKYVLLSLPERVGPQGLPEIEVVDRRAALRAGQDPILTEPLLTGLERCLGRREQALLLLNRRGYAQCLLCRECGVEALCPNCSVSLTVHERGRLVECHYCGHERETPERCASCGGEYLRLTGYGTERVLERLKEAFPEARLERVDRDLTRRRGAIERVLRAFESGEVDVLVGTQMIAKGHDFPNVTLVGVVDADVGLGLPDFRSAERTFQLLTQVAGRAGRGTVKGAVLLQSHLPEHYALIHACAQDYCAYFEREMEYRRTMGYPPFLALLNMVVRSREAPRAASEARAIAADLRAEARGRYRVLGPAAAPLARLHGDYRQQILMKGQRAAMRAAARTVLTQRYGAVRWPGVTVDVDPTSLM
jgi:primosomal protein N' (replication factor Y) (superfamily II helicase)